MPRLASSAAMIAFFDPPVDMRTFYAARTDGGPDRARRPCPSEPASTGDPAGRWRGGAVAAGDGALTTCRQRRAAAHDPKSSSSVPVGVDGLGPDAGAGGHEVVGGHLGNEAAGGRSPSSSGTSERTISSAPVRQCWAASRHVDGRVANRTASNGRTWRPPVGVATEGGDGVRPGVDHAVDASGEVDAEEGEPGVGHRVDEVADEVGGLGRELEVLAAEREGCGPLGRSPPAAASTIGPRPGTGHDPVGPPQPTSERDGRRHRAGVDRGGHADPGDDASAAGSTISAASAGTDRR